MVLPISPQTPPLRHNPCPFVPGPMIIDRTIFVGRRDELQTLIARMSGVQPVSINIVGERRIGKSSLLYHFFQTWDQFIQNSKNYIVIYLSLQNLIFQSRNGFYEEVIKGFLVRAATEGRDNLTSIFSIGSFDHVTFTQAFEQLRQVKVLPILCLDEFESLLKNKDEFSDAFYDHLRSLLNNNLLMIIVASNKRLDEYGSENLLTSNFFNLGLVLPLGELQEDEAVELVRLPASVVSGLQAALSIEEQRQARQLGGRNPFLLQLACSFLCQARQEGKTLNWAKKQFESQKHRYTQHKTAILRPRWLSLLHLLFVSFPLALGKTGKKIGQNINNVSSWLVGLLIIVIVVLAVFGILHISDLITWVKHLLGG